MNGRRFAWAGVASALCLAAVASGVTGAQAGTGAAAPAHVAVGFHHPTARPVQSVAQAERLMGGQATLNLIAHLVQSKALDVDPPGFSTGDVFLFDSRMFNEDRSQVVGRAAEHCEVGFDTYSCQTTINLPGRGKIRADGAFFEDNIIPVTGGTGEFVGAGGEFHVFLLHGHHDELYSFQLTR